MEGNPYTVPNDEVNEMETINLEFTNMSAEVLEGGAGKGTENVELETMGNTSALEARISLEDADDTVL